MYFNGAPHSPFQIMLEPLMCVCVGGVSVRARRVPLDGDSLPQPVYVHYLRRVGRTHAYQPWLLLHAGPPYGPICPWLALGGLIFTG